MLILAQENKTSEKKQQKRSREKVCKALIKYGNVVSLAANSMDEYTDEEIIIIDDFRGEFYAV